MKKILFAAMLLAVAGTASAQDKVVRKARDLKNEVQDLVATPDKKEKQQAELDTKLNQCMEMIVPTLDSPETVKERANAWDIKAQLHTYIFSPLLEKVIKKEPTDINKLAENIYASLDAIDHCYKATKELGLKGDKDPYTRPNQDNVLKFRPYIAFLGQMFFQEGQKTKNAEDFKPAVAAFKRWMSYPKDNAVLEELAEQLAADPQTPQIAYFTCLSAYFAKDYPTLMEFIPEARKYTQEKNQVNQLYMTALIEQGDTIGWLKAGREAIVDDPNNEAVIQNILSYYLGHNDTKTAMEVADDVLAGDEFSKLGNYAKGYVLMGEKKYEEAVTYFDKATETDPEFSDAYFNAGVCWSNFGYDINEAISNAKNMTPAQNKEELAKVRAAYAKAEPYFLKVQELEPENTHKWAGRLATIYYILENKAKQAEMEKLLE